VGGVHDWGVRASLEQVVLEDPKMQPANSAARQDATTAMKISAATLLAGFFIGAQVLN